MPNRNPRVRRDEIDINDDEDAALARVWDRIEKGKIELSKSEAADDRSEDEDDPPKHDPKRSRR